MGWDAGKPIGDGAEVNVLGRDERLQAEVLQNGGEEEKQLHASQAFSDTHPLSCSGNVYTRDTKARARWGRQGELLPAAGGTPFCPRTGRAEWISG